MNTSLINRRTLAGSLLAAAFLLSACAGHSARPLALMLDGSHEVPAVNTVASGSGEVLVAADHSVSGSITVSGMSPTMAHIHLAAAGQNGPVIIALSKAGEMRFVVPEGSKLSDSQYESYLAGKLYINVHSAAHPAGEIRVQLLPEARMKWY